MPSRFASRFASRFRVGVALAGGLATIAALVAVNFVVHTPAAAGPHPAPYCASHPQFCTETAEPWSYNGTYTGHDEPSLLYYSTVPGSGNSNIYQLTLPNDPPTAPNDNGTGGTWNFQLHPAFWFGMIMCDDQSAPNPGAACLPDSDLNLHNSTNPKSSDYIGLTPGQGFMEMQFYPPGWGNVGTGVSCGPDNTQWCAALNIDSFSSNSNTGQLNNSACLNAAGEEYVNYAIITKSGTSQGPADPLDQTLATFETSSDTLEMNSNDRLVVDMHDTAAGFQVVIHDQTTGETGSMTASIANGFGHPLFQPGSSTCTDQAYAYHPMFSTSTPNTRVYWAAHSYNVAYSDEIGHFEYCPSASVSSRGRCTTASVTDPNGVDSDDRGCSNLPLVNVPGQPDFGGCLSTDNDFDGPEYQHNWPGSSANAETDASLHAAPVTFTSPLFRGPGASGLFNYQQVAFEADLPRIEGSDTSTNNACQRHVFNPADPSPGAGCVDPPNGASFYPFYSAVSQNGTCVWEEGDANLANVINNFGGSSSAEYGGLLLSVYPSAGFTTTGRYNNFHRTLGSNPCLAPNGG